jgi:hypothetical protein
MALIPWNNMGQISSTQIVILLFDHLRDEDDPSFLIFTRPGFFDLG